MGKTDTNSGWLPAAKAEPDQNQVIWSNYETDNDTRKKEEPSILPIEIDIAAALDIDELDLLEALDLPSDPDLLDDLNPKKEENEEDTDPKPMWFTDYDPNKELEYSIRVTVKGHIKLKRAALRVLGNPKYLIFSSYEEEEGEGMFAISLRTAKKGENYSLKVKKGSKHSHRNGWSYIDAQECFDAIGYMLYLKETAELGELRPTTTYQQGRLILVLEEVDD
ncbi:MAG: hypothetical protein HXX20_09590 [Chloroflexi bacterium]|nr:hypothetical protein [Chloroflexota bacterium]